MSDSSRKLIDWRQAGILADRYLDVILGDVRTTLLLLLQAPLIAALIVLRWNNVNATDSLFFVLSLTAVWFGCVNAAREIVKEKRIFLRERMLNLNVGAYLYSKFKILALLNFLQCLALVGIVHYYVHLGSRVPCYFLILLITSLAGTALGLLISSWVSSEDKAVGIVPLVIIPQILFSQFVLPQDLIAGFAMWLEKLMIVKWSYDLFSAFRSDEIQVVQALQDCGVLAGFIVGFCGVALIQLKSLESLDR